MHSTKYSLYRSVVLGQSTNIVFHVDIQASESYVRKWHVNLVSPNETLYFIYHMTSRLGVKKRHGLKSINH